MYPPERDRRHAVAKRPLIRWRRLVLILIPLVAVELATFKTIISFEGHTTERPPRPNAAIAATSAKAARPELVLQTGHGFRVDGLAYSPDGRLLATGSADNTVKLWDTATGNELRTLRGQTSWVKAVAFSPDGARLAAGGVGGTVKIWEVSTGRERVSFDGCGSVNAIAFGSGGRLVAVGNMENQLKLLDAAAGRELKTLTDDTGWVTTLAFSPDEKLVASGSDGGAVKLWEVASGRALHTLTGHAERVRSIAFSPDGLRLASGGADTKVKLWRIPAGREEHTLTGHTGAVVALGFGADGASLASLGAERTTIVWDAQTGAEARRLRDGADTAPIEAGAFNPDRSMIALSTGDKTVRLWGLHPGGGARTLNTSTSGVYATVFSPDGRYLVTGGKAHVINVWEAATGRELFSLKGHTGLVTALAFSGDGEVLASASEDETIRVWDTQSGREARRWAGHEGGVFALALSRDGRTLVSGGADRTVKLWETATAREVRRLAGHGEAVTAVAFSHDERRVAAGSADGAVKVWAVESGQEVLKLKGHAGGVTSVAFSPDGGLLVTGGTDRSVKVWDAASGVETRSLEGHDGWVNAVAFSPDGRWLATGGRDHAVKLWETATWRAARSLAGHTDGVNAVAFSPDARWLATGSEDGSTRVWDAATGDEAGALLSLRDGAGWLVVSPEGLFDGSPAAWQKILWRFEQNTFNVAPVEVFFNEFYYPGLLGSILRGQQPAPPRGVAQCDRRQPSLKLSLADHTAATPAGVVRTREVRVKVDVAEQTADGRGARGVGARDVRLFRNGSLVKVWRGDLKLDARGAASLETTLPVVAGENRLAAYAFNRDNIKSADAELRITGADSLRRRGTAYILVVGLNKYANPKFNLKYAVPDAEEFGTELKRAQTELTDYEAVRVVPLLDGEATKANILARLEWLAGVTQPEDSVIFFFAGHGAAFRSQFFLIPHDLGYAGDRSAINADGMKTLMRSGISDRELERAVEGVMAGKFVLIIDACNSGQVLEAQEWRRGPMNSKGLAQLAYEKGMFVLTAAQSYQAALEAASLGHGLLTYALVKQGLGAGDADFGPKDGQVVLREWLDYAAEQVPRMQLSKMQAARELKLSLSFADGEDEVGDVKKRSLQRPRFFYRSDAEARSFVVSKLTPTGKAGSKREGVGSRQE